MSTTPDDFDNSGFRRGFDKSHQPNKRYVLSSSVLLTSVLCLVFVIVLVTVLHLYARYMLRRQLAQRRRRQAHLYRSAHAAASGAPGTVDQHRPPTGLDADSVAALPKFTYKKKEQDKDHPEAAVVDECSVCLSQLEEGETVRQLPACGHTFHDTCIDMWLYSHNTCPLCRKVVDPVSNITPLPEPAMPVEVVVVVQVGGGSGDGAGNHFNSRSSIVVQGAPPSQTLMAPATTDGCGGSGHEAAVSRMESFRRMFSLERAGGRRQQQGDDASQRDLERQQ